MTEHFTYTPPAGGWPPAGDWPPPYQAQLPYEPVKRPRRTGRLVAAVGGGLALLLAGAAGGFAAGWSAHPSAGSATTGGYTSPYLPLNPDGGLGPGSGDPGSQGSGSQGSGSQGSGSQGSGSQGSGSQGSGSQGSGSQGSGSGGTSAVGPSDSQIAAVAAKVDPALVDIDTVLGDQDGEAAGTGIVIGSDGVVLTNNHVVAGATSITVTDIGNHRKYRAAVVGYDRSHDIAVLRLAGASGLATATPAGSATVTAGQPVVAIGNAGGAGGTPTAVGGVVSALNQSITAEDESSGSAEQLTGLIEVNADIRAGDSGGPLLTTSGQVIGVDTAASAGFRYQTTGGDGFAIPIGAVTTVADRIRAGRSSAEVHIGETAYLGIETAGSARGFGNQSGPVVLGVVAGSPAESAGLSRGDMITSVAGATVGSATALTDRLDRYHPGDRVRLTWTDLSGGSHGATVRLATGPVG